MGMVRSECEYSYSYSYSYSYCHAVLLLCSQSRLRFAKTDWSECGLRTADCGNRHLLDRGLR